MSIDKVFLKNFRPFSDLRIDLSNQNLLLTGANGTGKTSVLEAINVLITGKSFKTRDLKDCIKDKSKGFMVDLEIKKGKTGFKIRAEKELNKRISRKAKTKPALVAKKDLPVIQFIQAKDLRMIEGETELRRDFFNKAMFHVEPKADDEYSSYKKTLSQRNMALKKKVSEKELKIWNKALIEKGSIIEETQKRFFVNFFENTLENRKEKKRVNLEFLNTTRIYLNKGWPADLSFEDAIAKTNQKDRALGYTTFGPHRLDLLFYTESKLARSVLSRGQQKLLILLMFFYFNDILKSKTKAEIIYLIDDITSELDQENLEIVLQEALALKSQLLITAIEGKNIDNFGPFLDKFRQLNLSK
ncbi:MAG: DNA replication and repair protein RecF [Pseudomonadota bacterium]|nr:DNA replication and repair protein RecF [Pseudomonadota bacterium]